MDEWVKGALLNKSKMFVCVCVVVDRRYISSLERENKIQNSSKKDYSTFNTYVAGVSKYGEMRYACGYLYVCCVSHCKKFFLFIQTHHHLH